MVTILGTISVKSVSYEGVGNVPTQNLKNLTEQYNANSGMFETMFVILLDIDLYKQMVCI